MNINKLALETLEDFKEETINHLESWGYFEYVVVFDPKCVAHSLADIIYQAFHKGASSRYTALFIFGYTFTHQILAKRAGESSYIH